ncbi:MAG TPA: MBL fold metallo-hydrolase [Chloroflexi bacterium]|nr:MBL fold metallo-hydrolase [Chloroflexota bacterium]
MRRITHLTAEITEIAVNLTPPRQGALAWGTRAYLLRSAARGRLLLIDTGSAGSDDIILQTIESLGHLPADLEAIILTHWHEDHSGSLGAMMDAAGEAARVLVPAGEIDLLRAQKPLPLKNWGWLGKSGPRPYSPGVLDDAQVARLESLREDDPLLAEWDLQLINAPGHSEGHISLLSPGRRTLFAGDALLCYKRTVLTFPHADPVQTEASARKLLELDFDRLLPGHVHAMPYRLSPADRQPVTGSLDLGWRLLEKTIMGRPLMRSTGPKLPASPHPTRQGDS